MESLLRESFLLLLVASVIPMAFSCAAGLVVSVIQTATQVNDQSINFFVRFLCISAVLAVTFDRFEVELVWFMEEMMAGIMSLGRMP